MPGVWRYGLRGRQRGIDETEERLESPQGPLRQYRQEIRLVKQEGLGWLSMVKLPSAQSLQLANESPVAVEVSHQ